MTGGIADKVQVSADDVRAAVFLLQHQTARNGIGIMVFRVAGLTSEELGLRWLDSQGPDCDPVGPRDEAFAGRPTRVTRQLRDDQCQPEYIVLLDEQTVAILVDDGGYRGNDPANPPPVPFRPTDEIEALVPWLLQQLDDVELQPGGPPQDGNG